MFESRLLSKVDSLFQHASGSVHLHEFSAEWYELKPRFKDEVYEVSALHLTIAGQDLLKHLEDMGSIKATVEFGFNLADAHGRIHDEAATTVHLIETADEWHKHTQSQTGIIVDTVVGKKRDGSERAALRGKDVDDSGPNEVTWLSQPIELRYGRLVESIFWELDNVRDEAGEAIETVDIQFRMGERMTDGTIDWFGWQTVGAADNVGEHIFPEPPPQGNFMQSTGDYAQWQIKMSYSTAFQAAYHQQQGLVRTAQLFLLGIRFQLKVPRWHFATLAELIQEADINSRLQANVWNGQEDLVMLRIPLNVTLHGRYQESIGARLTLKASATTTWSWPSIFQIQGDVYMRYDEET